MRTISKFHLGMIKASALGVLNAIRSNNYKSVISKAAQLRLLASKLGVNLNEVLPASVIKVIIYVLDKMIDKMYVGAMQEKIAHLSLSFEGYMLSSNRRDILTSLVMLPKLPALR